MEWKKKRRDQSQLSILHSISLTVLRNVTKVRWLRKEKTYLVLSVLGYKDQSRLKQKNLGQQHCQGMRE